jgi:hypothetical protein
MATSSPLFERQVLVWKHLALRSDVDDIILELLGHFSLEKIYHSSSSLATSSVTPSATTNNITEKESYQHLVISLLAKLTAIFSIQRLTLPSEKTPSPGRYLGLLVSWELTLRCVEFVLYIVAEDRDILWDCAMLKDRYLADFLLEALGLLNLYPKSPGTLGSNLQKSRGKRDRFARVHRRLELLLDTYPGPDSFLLQACRDITRMLQVDPGALILPPSLRMGLPNLATDMVCTTSRR